jgi:hypothetical protein
MLSYTNCSKELAEIGGVVLFIDVSVLSYFTGDCNSAKRVSRMVKQ